MCYTVGMMNEKAKTFWERVSSLMSRDIDRQWLSKETGISENTISGWKSKKRIPPADRALKIADALGVTVRYLLTGDDETEDFDIEEIEEPEIMEPKKIVTNGIFYTPSKKEYQLSEDESMVILPILDQKVSAGHGTEPVALDTFSDRHIPVMKRLVSRYDIDSLRAVEVSGDSMTGVGLIHEDVVIFVHKHIDGDGIYVIVVNGEIMVKRLELDHFEEVVRVYSENPRYGGPKVVPMDSETMQIQGKVVAWFHCHPY